MARIIRIVPTLLVPYILYHIFQVSTDAGVAHQMMSFTLSSGKAWAFTLGDFTIFLGLIFLYVEIWKSTRTSNDNPIFDHMLSLALFIICIIEFMMAEVAGTSTFFILTMMALVDVIGGFTISFTGARRDFGGGMGG